MTRERREREGDACSPKDPFGSLSFFMSLFWFWLEQVRHSLLSMVGHQESNREKNGASARISLFQRKGEEEGSMNVQHVRGRNEDPSPATSSGLSVPLLLKKASCLVGNEEIAQRQEKSPFSHLIGFRQTQSRAQFAIPFLQGPSPGSLSNATKRGFIHSPIHLSIHPSIAHLPLNTQDPR